MFVVSVSSLAASTFNRARAASAITGARHVHGSG
jgi:hypothetical protein